MAITERTLRKWRMEALYRKSREPSLSPEIEKLFREVNSEVLMLTQELLDNYLLKKKRRG
jgi:hypothetical protein